MTHLDPLSLAALGAAAMLMISLLVVRRRQRGVSARPARAEALDTVAAWPPEAARVLTVTERQAYEIVRRALPGFMVLAQVPLSRFIRVPTRHSYTDWMQRVGQLSADLVLCDGGSQVLAVVDIRSPAETERSRRRHERLARVLRAAGVRVLVWYEGDLPSVAEVRTVLGAALGAGPVETGGAGVAGPVSVPAPPPASMPLIPVPDISEILAEGDAMDHSMEPVPSGFYDDFDLPAPARR